jgi:hypothetical protein
VLPALKLSQGRKLQKYAIVLGNIETTAAERAARDGTKMSHIACRAIIAK